MAPPAEAPELGRDTLDPASAPSLWSRIFPARGPAFGLRAGSAPALGHVTAALAVSSPKVTLSSPSAVQVAVPIAVHEPPTTEAAGSGTGTVTPPPAPTVPVAVSAPSPVIA